MKPYLLEVQLNVADEDVGRSEESYKPPNPECFMVGLALKIGPNPEDKHGDLFYLRICSASWIHYLLEQSPYRKGSFGDGILFVRRFIYSEICDTVRARLLTIEGDSWEAVARQIDRFAPWEFA